jgi:uncharacterized protein
MNETITKIANYVKHVADPEMIILFGSVAEEKYNEYSDIDLLVVVENNYHRRHYSRQITAYAAEFGLPADVLVYSIQEIEAARLKPLSFLGSVLQKGKIIFEKSS